MISQPFNNPAAQQVPLVSILMNCLNSSKYLREAIDSVYAQTYQNWEIIFWDNASTDNSAEIAKSYDEKLRYFRSDKVYPLGQVRNWAIEQAKGKYIAFLDCDDIWFREKLEKQIPLFERNPKVGLVFCDTIFFDAEGREQQLYKKERPHRGQVFKELFKRYFLSMETVVVRREVLDGLSEWFDMRFNMIEETDLFLRIAYQGWEFDYVDEPLAKWRIHPESWTFAKKHLFPKEREMMLQKFSVAFKDFEKKFKKEIFLMRGKIQYGYALVDWEEGKTKAVRKRLYPYLGISKKFWFAYFLSFLHSHKTYTQLVSIYKNMSRHFI